MKFRNLRVDDYDLIVGVWRKSGLPVKLKGRESRENLAKQMAREPDYFFGAEVDDKLVGVVVVSDDGRKGWINRLAVLPEYRHSGVATALVKESERRIGSRGIDIVAVLIEDYNRPSLELFQKAGYVLHKDIFYLSKRESDET